MAPRAEYGVVMSLPIASSTKTERLPDNPNPWVLPARALTVFYRPVPKCPRLSHYFLPRLLFAKKTDSFTSTEQTRSAHFFTARFRRRERGLDSSSVNSPHLASRRAFTRFQLTELDAETVLPKATGEMSADVLIVTALPDLYAFDEDVGTSPGARFL